MKPASPILNQLINLFWTAVCCTPVVLYWSSADRSWLWPLLALSAPGLLISSRFYRLSRKRRFYESLGVKWVRLWVQDGELIARFTRKKIPDHRIIRNRRAGRNYLRTVTVYERYHFLGFLFFTFSTVHAVCYGRPGMALLLLVCNIIYNIYPLLLQQFNRIRLEKMK
ncbi:MAG TPA: hypothetical protein VGD92_10080 [Sphingobacteriaceae bacterium]